MSRQRHSAFGRAQPVNAGATEARGSARTSVLPRRSRPEDTADDPGSSPTKPGGISPRPHVFAYAVSAVYIVVTAVTPYLYGKYLAPLLGLALLVLLLQRARVPHLAATWAMGLGALGAFGTMVGVVNANPDAWATVSVFILEPLLIAPLFGILYSTDEGAKRLTGTLDFALIAVAVVGFLVWVSGTAGFQLPAALVDPTFTAVDLTGETLRTNWQGYNSLVFLGAYGVLRALRRDDAVSPVRRGALLLASISGVVLSGRRALYLTTPLVIAIAVVAMFGVHAVSSPRRGARVSLLVVGLTAVGGLLYGLRTIGLSVSDAVTRTIGQITLDDPSGVRPLQSRLLLERWGDSPFIGNGAGAVITGYARDITMPWLFELTYHMILMDFGLLGISILAIWGFGVLRRLIVQARRGQLVSQFMLAGFLGTVIASSTNPYVLKIDGMWMLFAPFAVSLHDYLTQRQKKSKR